MAHVLVVGAGFAGAVTARELADAGHQVLVVDRRNHVGGNAHDQYDPHGVLVHTYGPHVFHTNSDRIVHWLSRFTEWRPYEHRVLAYVDGRLLPIPISRATINALYGLNLDEAGAAKFFEQVREPRSPVLTSEDAVLSSVGRELCEKFFRGYTRKHWGLDLSELSASVASRIPTRTNDDTRYFTDRYQIMPLGGYTCMFGRMLDHPNIRVRLNTSYMQVRDEVRPCAVIYTGPIDEYFSRCFGQLPYRSLRFEHVHHSDVDLVQACGTINYPNEHAYTRTTEFKHLTGQSVSGTSVVYEYPESEGEPYYPIPCAVSDRLYRRYADMAAQEKGVFFVGRLAQYRYYNMDQVVAAAISTAESVCRYLRPE